MTNFEWLKTSPLRNNLSSANVKNLIRSAKDPEDLAKPSCSICKAAVRTNFTGDYEGNFCDYPDNPRACAKCALDWLTAEQSEWTKELVLV